MTILLKDPDLVSAVLLEATHKYPPCDYPLSEIISDIKEEMKNGEQVLVEVEYRISGIHGGYVSEIWYYPLSKLVTDEDIIEGKYKIIY